MTPKPIAAPTLGGDWRKELEALEPGWDSYDAPVIDSRAIQCLETFHVVPCGDGGIQLEVHRDGYDIEITISPEGRITSALVAHERGGIGAGK